MDAKEFFEVQFSSNGQASGPKLKGSLHIPYGMGPVFQDGAGNSWQLRLAENADGTLFIGNDGKPTIELIQVAV